MVAYKLAAAVFADEVLFSLAFFPVPGYVLTMAKRAIDLYIDLHSFIVSSLVLFVISRSSIHHTFWITSLFSLAEKGYIIEGLTSNFMDDWPEERKREFNRRREIVKEGVFLLICPLTMLPK
jgi:hypothetical protein